MVMMMTVMVMTLSQCLSSLFLLIRKALGHGNDDDSADNHGNGDKKDAEGSEKHRYSGTW